MYIRALQALAPAVGTTYIGTMNNAQGDTDMATKWTARRVYEQDEESLEAPTKREIMFLLSCNHLDEDASAERHGPGHYYYTAPRGELYEIRRMEA